ncbi:MAG: DUF4234 domain-containing protein [Methylacidiphilales bacterium]|nr:DUF4234 domain-containing protein [Candidatus Methylacidiphilales bacterium]
MKRENIDHFATQSVWGMIGLSLITLTFYFPFWLRKTSRIVNELLPSNPIGAWYFPVGIILTALNFGMLIPEMLTDDDPTVMIVSKLLNRIDTVFVIFWAFKIRNRIHVILESEKKTPLWFNTFWTFFFQMFYIQFRINRIKKAQQTNTREATPVAQDP